MVYQTQWHPDGSRHRKKLSARRIHFMPLMGQSFAPRHPWVQPSLLWSKHNTYHKLNPHFFQGVSVVLRQDFDSNVKNADATRRQSDPKRSRLCRASKRRLEIAAVCVLRKGCANVASGAGKWRLGVGSFTRNGASQSLKAFGRWHALVRPSTNFASPYASLTFEYAQQY